MRRMGIAMIAAVLLPAAAAAQSGGGDSKARVDAYRWAMRCYVADAHAMGLRNRAGDGAKASYYETKAHHSFDTAVRLGRALNLTGDEITRDISTTETSELVLLMKDDGYLMKVASTCKGLDLM